MLYVLRLLMQCMSVVFCKHDTREVLISTMDGYCNVETSSTVSSPRQLSGTLCNIRPSLLRYASRIVHHHAPKNNGLEVCDLQHT